MPPPRSTTTPTSHATAAEVEHGPVPGRRPGHLGSEAGPAGSVVCRLLEYFERAFYKSVPVFGRVAVVVVVVFPEGRPEVVDV